MNDLRLPLGLGDLALTRTTLRRQQFFIVTAIGEGAMGVALLVAPGAVLSLLLGASQPLAETLFAARIAGAALVALGISCWLARNDRPTPSQIGLLGGLLFYDAAAALLLTLAGGRWALAGIGLWPAVALHSALGIWCLACLVSNSRPSAATNH
jgi:hypothetical protein